MTNETDTCGHPTDNGPCQNPATEGDSCWIDKHGGDTSVGRDKELHEHIDDILMLARQGATKKGLARMAGVDESTFYRWLNDNPIVEVNGEEVHFCKSLRRARALGEGKQLQDLNNPDVNNPGARFLLERSYGYTKTEEVEVKGDDASTLTAEEKQQLDAALGGDSGRGE